MEEFDKKYYKIADVAEFIGVPQSTLRFWEKAFPEVSPMRSAKGVRYYTPEDIKTLKIIHFLVKIRGLKIEAAREQLAINKTNVSKRLQIISKLEEVKTDLEGLLAALTKRR